MVYKIAEGNWAWYCQCKAKQLGYKTEADAEKALASHMRSDAW